MKKTDFNTKGCCRITRAAQILFIITFILCICASCGGAQNNNGLITPPTLPNSNISSQTAASTAEGGSTISTEVPTTVPTPTAMPTPEPGTPDTLGLYIAENGQRILVDEFSSEWVAGSDIDCFEAIASKEPTLSGSFADIWNTAWNKFTNTKNVKIGYSLNIKLKSGENVSYDVKTPADAQQNRDYIEVYLYDDIHVSGWYSHLEDSDIKEDTVITSIKLTATQKQSEISSIELTAYLYTTDMPQRVISSAKVDVFNRPAS